MCVRFVGAYVNWRRKCSGENATHTLTKSVRALILTHIGFAVIAYAAFMPQRVFDTAFARHSLKRTRRFRVSSIQKVKKKSKNSVDSRSVVSITKKFNYFNFLFFVRKKEAADFPFLILFSSKHSHSPVVQLNILFRFFFFFRFGLLFY